MSHPVIFDPDRHAYTVAGQRLPSVTQILGAVYGDPTAGRGQQWHLDRGSAAHALYAALARGELDQYDYDPRLEPYIAGWQAWVAAEKPEIIAIEQPLHYLGLYAGTPDLICRLNGKLTIVDFKQSTGPRDRLQMAAYALATTRKIQQTAAVQIDGSGGWKYGSVERGGKLKISQSDWLATVKVFTLMKQGI